MGALIAGRVANRFDRAPRRWLPTAFGIEAFVIALVAVLAVALGIQNGTVHHLGVHDLTTTVLTLSLAGVVTDSQIARGPMARPHRRLGSIAAMLAGAGVGALLLFVSLSLVLALAASGTAVVATCFALVGRGAADTDNDQKRNR